MNCKLPLVFEASFFSSGETLHRLGRPGTLQAAWLHGCWLSICNSQVRDAGQFNTNSNCRSQSPSRFCAGSMSLDSHRIGKMARKTPAHEVWLQERSPEFQKAAFCSKERQLISQGCLLYVHNHVLERQRFIYNVSVLKNKP